MSVSIRLGHAPIKCGGNMLLRMIDGFDSPEIADFFFNSEAHQ